jgi:predicted Rossmann-fold nucleotide-binding protein
MIMNNTLEQVSVEKMTDADFFERIKEALVILSTSSGDKISDYSALFSALPSGENFRDKGINAHFTHIGAFGIANDYVAENEGDGVIHANNKLTRAMRNVKDHNAHINNKLQQGGFLDSNKTEKVSMVEDSWWDIDLSSYDDSVKASFLRNIKDQLKDQLRPEDQDILLKNLDTTNPKSSFPGAHLKPLQEHLSGGFTKLMNIIYNAAEENNMKDLRYISYIELAFGFHDTNETYNYHGASKGSIISREDFNKTLRDLPLGVAVTSKTIHQPDLQSVDPKTFDKLTSGNLLVQSSRDIPADNSRRNFAEWLQVNIGTHDFSANKENGETASEQEQKTKIAYLSPSTLEHGYELSSEKTGLLEILAKDDFTFTTLPTYKGLRNFPSLKALNDADILLLEAEDIIELSNGIKIDPNLSMLNYLAVTVQVDPESVNVPIILDNRYGQWNQTLKPFREATKNGRLIGDFPFLVANSKSELNLLLNEYAAITKQSSVVPQQEITPIPNDGKTSVFVAGGHANNNKVDKEQSIELGYYLASQDMRIVTGGGQIDGSMGGVHTGFIQYHLDKLDKRNLNISDNHNQALFDNQYNAEKLILDRPDVINALTQAGYIPSDMFYSYSTEDLMKIESPNGQLETVGATHQNVANRLLRLDNMLIADISVILSGGIGTYEEIDGWIRKKLEDSFDVVAANDNRYSPEKTLIIHNQDGFFDALLNHYGIMKKDGSYNKDALSTLNIKIANNPQQLEIAIDTNIPTNHIEKVSAERLQPLTIEFKQQFARV